MSGNSLSSNENKKALAEFDTFVQESLESRNLELKKSVFLRIYDYFARVLRTNCQSNDLQIQISKYLESWKTLLDEINRRIYSLDLENLGILVAEGFKICSLFILGYCFKIPPEIQRKIIPEIKFLVRAILSISTNYFQDQIIDVDTSILIKITKSFIEIAEVLTNTTLDLKLLADSWNFIIKLIGDYKQSLSQDISEIGRRIVKKFCTEISKTFTQIDDLKKAQIKQKLSIFFINSMYTLFQNSEKIQANEWSQILELYQNFLQSRRNSKADQKSNEYFRKIYKQVYQNEKLLENLNNYDLEIILETLLNLSEEPPQYSFNILIENNVFDSVIKNISESDLALQNVDIFTKIVETLTILRISQNSNVQFLKTFDEKMTFGILQTESVSFTLISIHVILQRLRFINSSQREKHLMNWIQIRNKFNFIIDSIKIYQIDVLLEAIFEILSPPSKKCIIENITERQFLEIFGLEKIESCKKCVVKDKIIKELFTFFEESQSMTQNQIENCLLNLKILSSINVKNYDLNNHVLKFLNFLISSSCDKSLQKNCIQFLESQNVEFRKDLIENMFEELKRSSNETLEYFYTFILKLLESSNFKSTTEDFIKDIKRSSIKEFFLGNSEEIQDFEICFKKRRLDFTSTPVGKNPKTDSDNLENVQKSLETINRQVIFLKSNLNRPLTDSERKYAKQISEQLQSFL